MINRIWILVLMSAALGLTQSACSRNRPQQDLPVDAGQGPGTGEQNPVVEIPEFWLNDYRQSTAADELKIGTYNVLNLFNSGHDRDELGNEKDDFTFLPTDFPGKKERCEAMSPGYYQTQCFETDWQAWRVDLKYGQIKLALDAQGDLPDLLSVQEIENGEVAAGLADALGYEAFKITNSSDERGIDVALFFNNKKLKYLDHEELILTKADDVYFEKKPTRNLLRVHFKILMGNQDVVLGVYANHWPSNGNPNSARMAAAKAMQKSIDDQTAKIGKDKYFVVVLGDFNTLETQKPNPFDDAVESESWENALVDSQKLALANPDHPFQKTMAPGTYWYHKNNSWDKLDRILFSKNFLAATSNVQLQSDTFRIVGAKEITETTVFPADHATFPNLKIRVPIEYNFNFPATEPVTESDIVALDPAKQGYSDHLPVVVKVKVRQFQ